MDQANEDEDPSSWTPDRLRKHQTLTLASDVTLLKCMQSLSMVCKSFILHGTGITNFVFFRGLSPVQTTY